jgi:hypothetical protein
VFAQKLTKRKGGEKAKEGAVGGGSVSFIRILHELPSSIT